MGSKKLKRKRFKCKKLEKFYKLKTGKKKKKKKTSLGICRVSEPDHHLEESNFFENLESHKNYSPSCTEEPPDIKHFAKIREAYFRYLQTVVSDNCLFCDTLVTEEMLENLALYLEQDALLACLQVDIYKKSMLKIIKDIKRCTEEKQVYKDLKKHLPDTSKEQTDVVASKTTTNLPNVETYSKIPIIAITRSDDNEMNNSSFWMEHLNYDNDPYYSVAGSYQEEDNANQTNIPSTTNSLPWEKSETYSSNYWGNEVPEIKEIGYKKSESVVASQLSNKQNDFGYLNMEIKTPPNVPYKTGSKQEEIDPLLKSRNQLQKSVEQTLNETEKVYKQKRDEQERAYIAQILEGDESLDERFNDSLSDNETESKENIDESNLIDRLERMRELFGVGDEESQNETLPEKQKQSNRVKTVNNHSRRPTIWRYEKFIQLHKYSIIAGEMTVERRQINQGLFLELFGEDSDEEHEMEYSSAEKYRSSCTERISSWVVKYLMPFYHDKRILGRSMFKSLGHYISEAIVDKIQYPDEWTVKYFVSKFFPPKKKYVCDADILNFQLD